MPSDPIIRACACCGLIQRIPRIGTREVARCARCDDVVAHARPKTAIARTAALALAALALYPISMLLPVLTISSMGRVSSSTIWGGVLTLMHEGQVIIALIVLVCSIVIPLLKLLGLLSICSGELLLHRHNRARAYRLIELTGRWSMVDVLLVAVLVAFIKLGDLMDVHPGPGVLAFAGVVALSLLASASFDPSVIWEESE